MTLTATAYLRDQPDLQILARAIADLARDRLDQDEPTQQDRWAA